MAQIDYYAPQVNALLAKAGTAVQPETTGELTDLATQNKNNLVAAINEVLAAAGGEYAERAEAAAEAAEEAAEEATTTLENAAMKNGSYDTLTNGQSKQLLSDKYTEDNAAYLFRPSGGNGADREFDTIVGVSLPWNQLAQRQVVRSYFRSTSEGVGETGIKITENRTTANATFGFSVSADIMPTHKVFVSFGISDVSASNFTNINASFRDKINTSLQASGTIIETNTDDVKRATILQITSESVDLAFFLYNATATTGTTQTFTISDLQIIDLTQLFGTTIADYVYALEQSETGAGVVWFRQYFPNVFYAYNPGNDLLHVQGLQSHDMRGFNQWDEEWELGGISDTTGNNINTDTNRIRGKNYCRCVPGASYYGRTEAPAGLGFSYRFYDANKKFVGAINNTAATNQVVVFPNNASYFRIVMTTAYGTTYNHDICINLSGSRNGEYEQYKEYSYPLDSAVVSRGVPKKDANGKLVYDGDRYLADGTVVRRYGIVDLGTLNWSWSAEANAFVAEVTGTATAVVGGVSAICSKYIRFVGSQSDWANVVTGYFALNFSGIFNSRMVIRDTAYTDAATFKAAMSGVYLVYELATPTTEEAEPFQSPQVLSPYGTEEYVLTAQGDVLIPVGHETKYPANLRAAIERVIEQVPSAPAGNGTYTLKVTVTGGVATYSWVSA